MISQKGLIRLPLRRTPPKGKCQKHLEGGGYLTNFRGVYTIFGIFRGVRSIFKIFRLVKAFSNFQMGQGLFKIFRWVKAFSLTVGRVLERSSGNDKKNLQAATLVSLLASLRT